MATLTANGWTTGQRTIATSAVPCSTASIPPKQVLLLTASSTNSAAIAIGPSTGVTTSLGYLLAPGATLMIPGAHGIQADPSKVYAICGSTAGQLLTMALQ